MTKAENQDTLLPKSRTLRNKASDSHDDDQTIEIEIDSKENEKKEKVPKGFEGHCALKEASCCKKLFFTWNLPIWKIAKDGHTLTMNMMGNMDSDFKAEVQTKKFSKTWERQKHKKGSLRLCKTLIRTYWGKILLTIVLVVIQAVCDMLTPYFLYHLLEFLQDEENNDFLQAYLLVGGMMTSQYLMFMFSEHFWIYTDFLGRKSKQALLGMISEKVLRISPAAKKTYTQGEILNRISSDTDKVYGIGQRLGRIFCIPILITIAMMSLFRLIGVAFFAGVGVIGISIIHQVIVARMIRKLDKKKKKIEDKRLEITNQVLQNMKTVKFAGWGQNLEKKINAKRNQQLALMRQRQKLDVCNHITYCVVPFLVSMTSFLVYLLQGNRLTPSIVFTVMMMFGILKGPLNELPWQIVFFIDFFISMQRIEEFLDQDDVSE